MMILKKIMYGLISLLGVTTIVGTGFCGWLLIPENGLQTPEIKIAINVTQEAQHGYFIFGNIATDKFMPDYLILDEGTYGTFDLFDGLSFYRTSPVEIKDENGNVQHGNVVVENDDLIVNYIVPDNFDNAKLKPALGISIELKDYSPVLGADGNPTYNDQGKMNVTENKTNNFKKFVTLVDEFSSHTETINGEDYLFYNTAAQSTLNTLNIDKMSGDLLTNITYRFNMNYLFKYTDFEHKPTDLEKYSFLQKAMDGRIWTIDIRLISRILEPGASK